MSKPISFTQIRDSYVIPSKSKKGEYKYVDYLTVTDSKARSFMINKQLVLNFLNEKKRELRPVKKVKHSHLEMK